MEKNEEFAQEFAELAAMGASKPVEGPENAGDPAPAPAQEVSTNVDTNDQPQPAAEPAVETKPEDVPAEPGAPKSNQPPVPGEPKPAEAKPTEPKADDPKPAEGDQPQPDTRSEREKALEAQLEGLRKQIADMASQQRTTPQKTTPAAEPTAGAEKPTEAAPQKSTQEFPAVSRGEDVDYLTKEMIDTLLDKPGQLNPALNAVRRSAVEEVFHRLPSLVATMVENQIASNRAIDKFFDEHKVLAPYRDFVALQATQIEEEHPDWTMSQILAETATRSKERLQLIEEVKDIPPVAPKTPVQAGLPGKTSARTAPKAAPSQSTFQQEFNDIL